MHNNIWGEEDNIYEDPDGAIYRVSSNDEVYCIISSDHMTSVSKLNSLYTILVKFYLTVMHFQQLKFTYVYNNYF